MDEIIGLVTALAGKANNHSHPYLLNTANAISASKWATGRTIALAGDLVGSVVIDGSKNVTLNVSVKDDSHNHTIANVDGLQAFIDNVNSLLLSDNNTLDSIQEIVNFIEINRSTLNALGISSIAGLQNALNGKVDNSRVLTNVPAGAKFTDTNTWRSVSDSISSTSTSTSASSKAVKTAYDKANHSHPYLGSGSNAVSASKWAIGRTISLAGDATGSVTIDGTANKTLTLTVKDDSHNHTISNVDGLQTALNGKVDDSQVLTNVPAGAKFTDTNTWRPATDSLTSTSTSTSLSAKGGKDLKDWIDFNNKTYHFYGYITLQNLTSGVVTKLDFIPFNNSANAYNESSDTYQAFSDGLYQINCNVFGLGNGQLFIYKNGNYFTALDGSNAAYNDDAYTASISIPLDAGDLVSIYAQCWDTGTIRVHGATQTNYSRGLTTLSIHKVGAKQ